MEMPSDNVIAVENIENSLNLKENYNLLDSQNQTQESQAHFFSAFQYILQIILVIFQSSDIKL